MSTHDTIQAQFALGLGLGPAVASRDNLLSSLGAHLQPRCTSLHQSDGFKIDHTRVSLSSKSESAGHRMRTAPAGNASFERFDFLIFPSDTSSTVPSHHMNTCAHVTNAVITIYHHLSPSITIIPWIHGTLPIHDTCVTPHTCFLLPRSPGSAGRQ